MKGCQNMKRKFTTYLDEKLIKQTKIKAVELDTTPAKIITQALHEFLNK